jgi:DNA-binding ferritin-like protein
MENTLIIKLEISNTDYFDNHDLALLDYNTEVDLQYATFNSVRTLFPVTTGYEPTTGDKLFFAKSVNIPRVKLKNLTKDYKIKATTKIEDASAVFISDNTTAKYTEARWHYNVKTEKFKEFFQGAVDGGYIDNYYADKVNTALEFYENEYIAIEYNTKSVLEDVHIPFRLTEGVSFSSQKLQYISDEYVSSYKDMLNFTGPIYDESELLKYLNGSDALAIEENMYESLCEMFDSSDRDNHTLAMEIMANSQFEDSILYLSLLFNKYYNRIQDSRSKSHVNFKSLLALMDIRSSYYHLNIDEIVERLKKHGKLTKESVDIILKKLGDQIIDGGGDSQYFKIKTITMTEEMLAVLNLNYEYTLHGDFTPQSPEIEEEVVEETVSLEEEAVVATVEETVEEVVEIVEEVVQESVKEMIDFDNVIVESKTNNDEYFL